ncbi:outer membrane beta-barrel protein [Chryseolinea lacunae]|uniref:Outer membrane beta-barrel protein n=1 Tax=Chryseolinea lacunae TaxID=2801331 RepID=A0ABS1KZW2_9BACT|nr:outer membrane beta-barrel protein [Chryseolinea lacunae]MBL0744718.1 outer membrane beta-barrel protein [Chryseolinea lacunae]
MKKILLSVFVLSSFWCSAQTRFMFGAGANLSHVSSMSKDVTIAVAIPQSTGFSAYSIEAVLHERYEGRAGFQAGMKTDIPLSSRFFISTGLTASWIRYQRFATLENFPVGIEQLTTVTAGSPMGSIVMGNWETNVATPRPVALMAAGDGKVTQLYAQVPVLAGLSFFDGKLVARAGATFGLLAHASENKNRYDFATQTFETYKDTDKGAYQKAQVSGTLEATYFIGHRLGIDLSASRGITSLYSDSNTPHVSTVMLGLNYSLTK